MFSAPLLSADGAHPWWLSREFGKHIRWSQPRGIRLKRWEHKTCCQYFMNWEIRGDFTPSSWVFSPEKLKLLRLAFVHLSGWGKIWTYRISHGQNMPSLRPVCSALPVTDSRPGKGEKVPPLLLRWMEGSKSDDGHAQSWITDLPSK